MRNGETRLTEGVRSSQEGIPGACSLLISLTFPSLHLGPLIPLTWQMTPSAKLIPLRLQMGPAEVRMARRSEFPVMKCVNSDSSRPVPYEMILSLTRLGDAISSFQAADPMPGGLRLQRRA